MRCGEARVQALRQAAGEVGRFGRWRLSRHLAGCAECRAFAAAAVALPPVAVAAVAEAPNERIARFLHVRAAAELDAARGRVRARDAARWGGALASAATAAAVAGLLLALVRPTAFSPSPHRPAPLDERIADAQDELDRLADPVPLAPATMRLDERLHSIDRQLRCLDVEIDDERWEAPRGDTPCTAS